MRSVGQLATPDTADVVNVLVTTGQLVPTLGKLLLFKLDGAFKATCKPHLLSCLLLSFPHAAAVPRCIATCKPHLLACLLLSFPHAAAVPNCLSHTLQLQVRTTKGYTYASSDPVSCSF